MNQNILKAEILELLEQAPRTAASLWRRINRTRDMDVSGIEGILLEMQQDGQVQKVEHEYYVRDDRFKSGVVKYDRQLNYSVVGEEGVRYFVYPEDSGGAVSGDHVTVMAVSDRKEGSRPRYRIISVESRGANLIVGTFKSREGREGLAFYPDQNMPFRIEVDMPESGITDGTKVSVKLTGYPQIKNGDRWHKAQIGPARAEIVQILGKKWDKGMRVLSRLAAKGIDSCFSEGTLAELKNVPEHVENPEPGRTDLRDLMTVTIDGDDSRDFDDAVSVRRENDGWTLWVHIADVSHYVQEGSAIDQDAYKRGTSVYAADRVVPMLSLRLSAGICSLNPNEDRLAVTCEMKVSAAGELMDARVYESIIRSDMRCTYGNVNRALDGDTQALTDNREILGLISEFHRLWKMLKERSEDRGTIEFSTAEPKFTFNEKKEPVSCVLKKTGTAEKMIEEAMVLANTAVASILNRGGYPGIYRVHDGPDEAKTEALFTSLGALRIRHDLQPGHMQPSDFKRVLASVEDESLIETVKTLMLRSMMKAVYAPECAGHYGLALKEYCHFTSPIRRYPDLIVHRMLKKYVLGKADREEMEKDVRKIREQALHLTEREINAVKAERDVNAMLMAWIAEGRIGELGSARITGVSIYGMFVQMPNGMEGLVPLRTMPGHYMCDTSTMALVDLDNHRKYMVGETVQVEIADASKKTGRITFALAEK